MDYEQRATRLAKRCKKYFLPLLLVAAATTVYIPAATGYHLLLAPAIGFIFSILLFASLENQRKHKQYNPFYAFPALFLIIFSNQAARDISGEHGMLPAFILLFGELAIALITIAAIYKYELLPYKPFPNDHSD